MIVLISYLALLAVYFYAHWEANRDFKAIMADGSRDSLKDKFHLNRWLKRAGLISAFGVSLLFYSGWLFIIYLPLAAFIFWLVFDRALNKLRGLPPDYVGSTAKIDKYFKRFPNPGKAMHLTKLWGLGVLGLIYILIIIINL